MKPVADSAGEEHKSAAKRMAPTSEVSGAADQAMPGRPAFACEVHDKGVWNCPSCAIFASFSEIGECLWLAALLGRDSGVWISFAAAPLRNRVSIICRRVSSGRRGPGARDGWWL